MYVLSLGLVRFRLFGYTYNIYNSKKRASSPNPDYYNLNFYRYLKLLMYSQNLR